MTAVSVSITVINGSERRVLQAPVGGNLRQLLLENGLSPYAALTQRANCGGRGLCATCGVWIEDAPPPEHWHDKLAHRFRYPRLSCQITITAPLTVHLIPEKWIWGSRK